MNLTEKMIHGKIKQSKTLPDDLEIMRKTSANTVGSSKADDLKYNNFFNQDEIRKMNPFFNDFNNFEEMGKFKDLVDCLLENEYDLGDTKKLFNEKVEDDKEDNQIVDLIKEINEKENQYVLAALTNLKKENFLSYYMKKLHTEKEIVNKMAKLHAFSKDLPFATPLSNRFIPRGDDLHYNVLEELFEIEAQINRYSNDILDTRECEEYLKTRIGAKKLDLKDVIRSLGKSKESVERFQVKALQQDKIINDIHLQIKCIEEKEEKLKIENEKRIAVLIELEKKKLIMSSKWNKNVVFSQELNKRLTVNIPH